MQYYYCNVSELRTGGQAAGYGLPVRTAMLLAHCIVRGRSAGLRFLQVPGSEESWKGGPGPHSLLSYSLTVARAICLSFFPPSHTPVSATSRFLLPFFLSLALP